MAKIRSSSIVSLTAEGVEARRSQTLSLQWRDIVNHLIKAPDQTLTVGELFGALDAKAQATLGADLGGLAKNGWVLIPDAVPVGVTAPVEEEVPANGSQALSELLTRRPPSAIEVPIEPTPVAPAPPPPAVEGPVVPRTAIEVRSDEERDRRMLEAMGILSGPNARAPAPAPRPAEEPRREKVQLSPRDLMERIQKKTSDS